MTATRLPPTIHAVATVMVAFLIVPAWAAASGNDRPPPPPPPSPPHDWCTLAAPHDLRRGALQQSISESLRRVFEPHTTLAKLSAAIAVAEGVATTATLGGVAAPAAGSTPEAWTGMADADESVATRSDREEASPPSTSTAEQPGGASVTWEEKFSLALYSTDLRAGNMDLSSATLSSATVGPNASRRSPVEADVAADGADNFYAQLNFHLRAAARDPHGSASFIRAAAPFMCVMTLALKKMPAVAVGTVVYRGLPPVAVGPVLASYRHGRLVRWSAVTSASTNRTVAMQFAMPSAHDDADARDEAGVLMIVSVSDGRRLPREFSSTPELEEVILPPGSTFVVAREPTRRMPPPHLRGEADSASCGNPEPIPFDNRRTAYVVVLVQVSVEEEFTF